MLHAAGIEPASACKIIVGRFIKYRSEKRILLFLPNETKNPKYQEMQRRSTATRVAKKEKQKIKEDKTETTPIQTPVKQEEIKEIITPIHLKEGPWKRLLSSYIQNGDDFAYVKSDPKGHLIDIANNIEFEDIVREAAASRSR